MSVQEEAAEGSLAAPLLSKSWSGSQKFSPFFAGGFCTYISAKQQLYTQRNGFVCVVNPKSSAIIAKAGVADDSLSTFVTSSDGTLIVTASINSRLFRLWSLAAAEDAEEETEAVSSKQKNSEQDNVKRTEALSSKSKSRTQINLESDEEEVAENVTLVRSWKGPNSVCRAMDFDATGTCLAASFADGSVMVYNVPGGFCTHSFPSENSSSPVTVVKYHPHRLILFTAGDDGLIKIYDLYRHCCIARLSDHVSPVTCLDFVVSPQGNNMGALISGSRDAIVNVWSLDAPLQKAAADFLINEGVFGERKETFKQKQNSKKKQPSQNDIQVMFGMPLSSKEISASATRSQKRRGAAASGDDERTEQPISQDVHFASTKAAASIWLNWAGAPTIAPVHQIPAGESVESILCIPTRLLDDTITVSGKPLKTVTPWVAAIAGTKGIISFWHPGDRSLLLSLKTPHRDVGAVTRLQLYIGPHNRPCIMSVGEDHNFAFWELSNLQLSRVLLGQPAELIHVEFVPVALAHHSTYLTHLRDQERQQKETQKSLEGTAEHEQLEEEENVTPPFERLLVLRGDKRAVLMETSEGFSSASILAEHQDTVISAAASIDGCWIATGGKDSRIIIHSSRTGMPVSVLEGHSSPVLALKFNRRKFKNVSCSCLTTGPGTLVGPFPQDLSSGGLILVAVDLDGILKVWVVNRNSLRDAAQKEFVPPFSLFEGDVMTLEPGSDRKTASLSNVQRMTRQHASVVAHEREVNAIAIAPNDKVVATASSDHTIKIWTLPDLKLQGTCTGHRRAIYGVDFSPIERVIASASGDRTIKLWNITDFTCLKTLQDQANSVLQQVRFLPSGAQLLAANNMGQLKLWTVRTSDNVGTFSGHKGGKIWSLDIDHTGSKGVTCGTDESIILWKDATASVEAAAAAIHLQEAEDAAAIATLSRSGRTIEALTLAARLNRPQQMRDILQKSFEKGLLLGIESSIGKYEAVVSGTLKVIADRREQESSVSLLTEEEISDWVRTLGKREMKNLLEILTKWNANGKTASLANALMNIVLTTTPSEKLLKINGFPQLIESFTAYNPRHQARLASLLQRSFLIDIALYSAAGAPFQTVEIPPRSAIKGVEQQAQVPLSAADVRSILFE